MKLLKLLFVMFFLLCSMGIANAMPISWDLDGVGITGSSYDSNNQTDLFTGVTFYSETTVTQYDTDGNNVVNTGDKFSDNGALVANGFVPTGIDGEGLGSGLAANWYLTGTMDNFAGEVTGVTTPANPGDDTRIDYRYDTGTLNLYASGTMGFDFNGRDNSDDTGFDTGILVGTFEVKYGVGHTFINFSSKVDEQGSGEFLLEATYLRDDFWFNEKGEDLAKKYDGTNKPLNWFISLADYNVNDPITTTSSDPGVLFKSSPTHDGSLEFGAVPEPSTMILLGFGLLGLAGISRKKFFKKS